MNKFICDHIKLFTTYIKSDSFMIFSILYSCRNSENNILISYTLSLILHSLTKI